MFTIRCAPGALIARHLNERQALEVMRTEVERGFWNRELFELFASQVVPILDEQFAQVSVNWPGE